ncbi:MAG: FlgD immunoglobulin-like domain containing protein [bacterium]
MKKRNVFLAAMNLLLLTVFPAGAQTVDWRFGFEYNEIGAWSAPHHQQLLATLERVCTSGGINVNGLGSWNSMQSSAGAAIDFTTPDAVVALFQRHGFSLTWYLRSDARWAWVNPNAQVKAGATMAPAADKEDDWQNYVRAIVERYDGDGVDDMPGLRIPIQFYIMIGEVKFDKSGLGDNEDPPFWADTIDNLLRLHRLTYQAVQEADPTGFSKVVSSGAILWDLYADFPDYPEFDPAGASSAIRRRLSGENNRGSTYTAGWDSLKKMLDSFGSDADGIECDYIGWHPHFSWRVIDQEFKLIRAHAGEKPIYVDDMWSNLFAQGYAAGVLIPGEAQFTAPAFPPASSDWVRAINGDFPNPLFTSLDPYAELFQKLNSGDQTVLAWYYANGARRLVKSFASAFGEGAERVSYSGSNDLLRGFELGWLNLTGTRDEDYFKKPQFYTYKLLVEMLRGFTEVTEIPVSADPRTRVYRFDRSRGPVYVMWSETGEAPPNLDYSVATGETVTFTVTADSLIRTHLITRMNRTEPGVEILVAENRQITLQLGYEPILLEEIHTRTFSGRDEYEVAIPNLHNTATNVGIFGKQDKSTASGVWPCNSNNHYLFIGDLWVGAKLPNGEVKVTESVSPESADDPEWIPTSAISIRLRPLSESDEETRTTYRSDETGIEVTQRTFAWRDADFILYSFELYNTGSAGDLDSVFVGLRWDFDVSSAAGEEFQLGDLVGLDIDNSAQQPVLGYVRDEDGDNGFSPGWIGNYFLNTPVFTHTFWSVGTDQFFDEDLEQFRALASGQFQPDASSATDYRLLQAVGPFTLTAGDTLGPIDVALVIGAGLDGLRASRNAAVQKYLIVDVETPPVSSTPDAFELAQNYPNPFNPATTITYTVPLQQGNAIVNLQVFNLLGQKVRTLVKKKQQAGHYAIQWDGKDDFGVPVSSGVYLYRLVAGSLFEVKKMALIR